MTLLTTLGSYPIPFNSPIFLMISLTRILIQQVCFFCFSRLKSLLFSSQQRLHVHLWGACQTRHTL